MASASLANSRNQAASAGCCSCLVATGFSICPSPCAEKVVDEAFIHVAAEKVELVLERLGLRLAPIDRDVRKDAKDGDKRLGHVEAAIVDERVGVELQKGDRLA